MRTEHDFLGERQLPDNAYYGVQTLRGSENFHITGIPISHATSFIAAFGYVKKAAALANKDLGVVEPEIADAICKACDAIIAGELHDQFIVDVIQGGAGTSTNMNANEVIANKALEILGRPKGDYDVVHPNNHVNFSQSTNDAYPTAFRLSLYIEIGKLIEELGRLQESFAKKGREFKDVIKMGRTQLQDAVPMTLGQEFESFSVNIGEDLRRLEEARALITEVNLGATAIGTSINAPEGYPALSVKYLAEVSGVPVILSHNLIEATWDNGAYVQVSGVLKRVAVKLSKICNDLRLLSSGPRCGFNEINLPRLQPGSSIMPGKVNPVIPEVVNQVCFLVIGNDVTVTFAAEAGQLQLNVMEPVLAYCLFQSIETLTNACSTLRERCIDGITANAEHARSMVMNSIGIVTALNPILGYEVSAAIAKEAYETGGSVIDIVRAKGLLDDAKIDEIFSLENLMHPKFIR
ncbi:MAG: aspartate ammonia-lyase [Ignavibacteria bacterium]|nr:aspartate ammonia-lyase [Ignavibacteria bacterium]MBP7093133.1 aspartate ammonia-lyase [Candidatus Kapabacteria bacterium]MBK6760526.1 aspartate ammonia-lyase [Ignavibacteria bacterium]MBK7186033.1 aspartate ammonia-lyase [Ignavibacteria bacterium]MBK7411570.1 aspartate ammonia-lyase [Ignavibacteria bacterium]